MKFRIVLRLILFVLLRERGPADIARGVTIALTVTPRTTHWEMCGTICAGSLTLQNLGRRAYLYMGDEAQLARLD